MKLLGFFFKSTVLWMKYSWSVPYFSVQLSLLTYICVNPNKQIFHSIFHHMRNDIHSTVLCKWSGFLLAQSCAWLIFLLETFSLRFSHQVLHAMNQYHDYNLSICKEENLCLLCLLWSRTEWGSEGTTERSEQTRERTSEWSSTSVCILRCSGLKCCPAFFLSRTTDVGRKLP